MFPDDFHAPNGLCYRRWGGDGEAGKMPRHRKMPENGADRASELQANTPALHQTQCGASVAQPKRMSAGPPQRRAACPRAAPLKHSGRGVLRSEDGVHALLGRVSS